MSETKYTNEELALRVINGDNEALHLLYDQNVGLITDKYKEAFGYCGSPADADFDDLNQEAALSFIRDFEKNGADKEAYMTCPSPDVIYQMDLEYLAEFCRRIREKYREEMEK